jgi:DNA-binding response OmpR family regulator
MVIHGGATLVNRHRILVVEDDATMRGALGDLLDDEGHDVVTASHGGEALEHLAEHGADLIVLDIAMPERGAFRFREEQVALGIGLDARVLVLSEASEFESAGTGLRADRWMEKPTDVDALMTTVNELLREGD